MQEALRLGAAGGLEAAQADSISKAVLRAYLADSPDGEDLAKELDEGVRRALHSIRAAGVAAGAAGRSLQQYRATGDHLGLEYEPMFSLRDVAEGLPFYVQAEGRHT
jgi:hypothetical protein